MNREPDSRPAPKRRRRFVPRRSGSWAEPVDPLLLAGGDRFRLVDRGLERRLIGLAGRRGRSRQGQSLEIAERGAGSAARGLEAGDGLLGFEPGIGAPGAGPGRATLGGGRFGLEVALPGAGLVEELGNSAAQRGIVGDDRGGSHRLLAPILLLGRPRRQRRERPLRNAACEEGGGERREGRSGRIYRPSLCAARAGRNTALRGLSGGCVGFALPLCRSLPRARSSAG